VKPGAAWTRSGIFCFLGTARLSDAVAKRLFVVLAIYFLQSHDAILPRRTVCITSRVLALHSISFPLIRVIICNDLDSVSLTHAIYSSQFQMYNVIDI
jgi:hypothetical protein